MSIIYIIRMTNRCIKKNQPPFLYLSTSDQNDYSNNINILQYETAAIHIVAVSYCNQNYRLRPDPSLPVNCQKTGQVSSAKSQQQPIGYSNRSKYYNAIIRRGLKRLHYDPCPFGRQPVRQLLTHLGSRRVNSVAY